MRSSQPIFEITFNLIPALKKPILAKPIIPRDMGIYRLHTEEKRAIPSPAKE